MVYRPLPRTTRILVAARIDQLPQPSAVLGSLNLKPSAQPGAKDAAIRKLVASAPKHGCDALAEVVFARSIVKTVRRQRVVKGGRVMYQNVVHQRPVTRWTSRCLRTSQVGFAGGRPAPDKPARAAAAPAAAPAASPAQPARTATVTPAPTTRRKPVAKRAPTAAERRAAAAAERKRKSAEASKSRKDAAAARKAKAAKAAADKKSAEARKKAQADLLAKEEAAAAAHRKAEEDAERQRQRKSAEAAAKVAARKNYEGHVKNSTGSQDPAVQVTFLARWPDRPESAEVFTVLQQTARAHSERWVKSARKSVRTEKGDKPRDMDEARLKDELKKAGADMARFIYARSATFKHTVRNPTSQPALFELEANGGRLRVLVGANKTVTATQTVDCGSGGPVSQKRVRGVLEVRYGCAVEQPASIVAMMPVDREVAIARNGVGDNASLDAIGQVLGQLLTTRTVDLQLATIDAILDRRRGIGGGVTGGTKIVNKDPEAGMIDVKATLVNRSGRDVTAVFDAGTGRLTRLPVKRGGKESITLPMAMTVTPKLVVKDVLPRLRTRDWLPGHWKAGDAVLVILPAGKEGYVGFAIGPKGDGTGTRVNPIKVEIVGARVLLAGKVPLEFAREGLPEAARQRCASGCQAKMSTALTSLGKFEVGGPRQMALMLEAGGAKASITFRAAR